MACCENDAGEKPSMARRLVMHVGKDAAEPKHFLFGQVPTSNFGVDRGIGVCSNEAAVGTPDCNIFSMDRHAYLSVVFSEQIFTCAIPNNRQDER